MCMLTNVISDFTVAHYGALNVISWKYTFKRLNEEYEIANKKKQALDNLFESGKISQATRDSFTSDISAAIVEIEKQRKDLAEKMNAKTQELESQLKTLEMLLANYEIQHVVGEIDEESYAREINLLTTTLQTTRNELEVIKHATNQLSPIEPTIQDPVAPEQVAPAIEEVAQTAPVEAAPLEIPIESVIETAQADPVETAPEAPVETMQEEVAQFEVAPNETPSEAPAEETAPLEIPEEAPVEHAAIETPFEDSSVNESTPLVEESPEVETSVETPILETSPTIEEAAPIEEVTIETEPTEIITEGASYDTSPVEETPIVEAPEVETSVHEPVEEAPANPDEPKTVEITAEAPSDEAIADSMPEEPIINIDEAPVDKTPEETMAPMEEVSEVAQEQQVVDVPLQTFEVTEQTPVETTLEKVLEEPEIESVSMVEEDHIPAHPSEAPQQAHSELTAETDTDQTDQADENDENTTTE
jgi:polyhydroxyalkanoate synthesis regulator phasin